MSMEDVKRFEFAIEGTTPYMQGKFSGQQKSKDLKEQDVKVQVEAATYRDNEGICAIPSSHIRGVLIDWFVRSAAKGNKTSTEFEVSPRIRVEPLFLSLGTKKPEIYERSIQVRQGAKVSMDFVASPIFHKWTAKGTIVTTLDEDMKAALVAAGRDIGIGVNRKNGYGRFRVTSFNNGDT